MQHNGLGISWFSAASLQFIACQREVFGILWRSKTCKFDQFMIMYVVDCGRFAFDHLASGDFHHVVRVPKAISDVGSKA